MPCAVEHQQLERFLFKLNRLSAGDLFFDKEGKPTLYEYSQDCMTLLEGQRPKLRRLQFINAYQQVIQFRLWRNFRPDFVKILA